MRIAIDWASVGRSMLLFAAIGAFMAFINPYEAARGMSFFGAFVYWTALIIVGGIAGQLGFHLAEMIQKPAHWSLGIFFASTTSALAVTLAIYALAVMQYGIERVPLSELPAMYGLVFIIALAISSVAYLFDQAQEVSKTPATALNPIAKFLERLPVKFRTADLYAISSEDHYLRVHTSLGEEMILMRLADAVRELSGADGLQTHRGWWVAKDGVADTKRDNGKLALILKSGAEAPVSRTYTKAVKEAGLAE